MQKLRFSNCHTWNSTILANFTNCFHYFSHILWNSHLFQWLAYFRSMNSSIFNSFCSQKVKNKGIWLWKISILASFGRTLVGLPKIFRQAPNAAFAATPVPLPIFTNHMTNQQCLSWYMNTLWYRNFQNVKSRYDFVEIWSFDRHSDFNFFTWNQISQISKFRISKIAKSHNSYSLYIHSYSLYIHPYSLLFTWYSLKFTQIHSAFPYHSLYIHTPLNRQNNLTKPSLGSILEGE